MCTPFSRLVGLVATCGLFLCFSQQTYANHDYICKTLHSAQEGCSCDLNAATWGNDGTRFCTGTYKVQTITRYGNTRVGCPQGPEVFQIKGEYNYGDLTNATEQRSCALRETDLNPPFITNNQISDENNSSLEVGEKAGFNIIFRDRESGIKEAVISIIDPEGNTSLSTRQAKSRSDRTADVISSYENNDDYPSWIPENTGQYKAVWSAVDKVNNQATGEFFFYVRSGGGGGGGGGGGAEDKSSDDSDAGSSVCGNGLLESGENCDNGTNNGTPDNNCDNNCRDLSLSCIDSEWCELDPSGNRTNCGPDQDPRRFCLGKTIIISSNCGNRRELTGAAPGTDCAPPITIVNPQPSDWTNGSVNLTCSDIGSECRDTYFTTDGTSPTVTPANEYSSSILIRQNSILKFFSRDTRGNTEAIQTKRYTGGENIKIIGSFFSTKNNTSSSNLKKVSLGDLNFIEAKNNFRKNTASTRQGIPCSGDITISNWNNIDGSCLSNSGSVAYFKRAKLTLASFDLASAIENGSKTILIEDGNLHIKSDLISGTSKNTFGVIMINSQDDADAYGNVFIYENVKNIAGLFYLEGSVLTVFSDSNPRGYIFGSSSERASGLVNQLYWQGSIVSRYNTTGGSDMAPPQCPDNVISGTCDFEKSNRYDIVYLRYLNTTTGSYAAGILPDWQRYSVIIRYDSKALHNPPPLFSNLSQVDGSQLR